MQEERDAATDAAGITAIRRERDKMRQRNSRLARKCSLPTRRERGQDEG